MKEFKIKNENGLELTITTENTKEYMPISGGKQIPCDWEEYLQNYKPEYHQHLELLKKAISEIGWIGETAENICNYYDFVFSDGVIFGFTWRAWGDLMDAIVGKKEGYMAYYM